MTPHFSLAELTRSNTATRLKLENTPTPDALERLQATAEMLERIREHLGYPLTVTSGYRSPEVNKAVGGVTSSDHAQGMAADFVCPGFGSPFEVCKALAPHVSVLDIRQLIYERVGGKTWVHVSTRQPAKVVNRVITASDSGFLLGVVA